MAKPQLIAFRVSFDGNQGVSIRARDWHHAFAQCMDAMHKADTREARGGAKAWDGKTLTLEKL